MIDPDDVVAVVWNDSGYLARSIPVSGHCSPRPRPASRFSGAVGRQSGRETQQHGAGGAIESTAHATTSQCGPCMVDPCTGLTRLRLDEVQRWLLALPICGVY